MNIDDEKMIYDFFAQMQQKNILDEIMIFKRRVEYVYDKRFGQITDLIEAVDYIKDCMYHEIAVNKKYAIIINKLTDNELKIFLALILANY